MTQIFDNKGYTNFDIYCLILCAAIIIISLKGLADELREFFSFRKEYFKTY